MRRMKKKHFKWGIENETNLTTRKRNKRTGGN